MEAESQEDDNLESFKDAHHYIFYAIYFINWRTGSIWGSESSDAY